MKRQKSLTNKASWRILLVDAVALASAHGYVLAAGFAESDLLELWEPSGKLIKRLKISSYTLTDTSFKPDEQALPSHGYVLAVGTLTGGTGIIQLR